MIDKITPRPDPAVKAMLEKDSIADLDPVITTKNTYVAPFVNAEECQYLIIEDAFPNGKLPLISAASSIPPGKPWIRWKNEGMHLLKPSPHLPRHFYGCLLGYTLIAEEMKTPSEKWWRLSATRRDFLWWLIPASLDPKQFIDEVVK